MFMGPIIAFLNTPMSKSLTMFWNFGSMLGMILTSQIVTGILLAICFTPDGMMAFSSVQYIMYEVNFGWLVRLIHFNGASLFFIFLFLHLFKGMVFLSFRLAPLWWSGITILILVMGAAFFGYVVVWPQMSYWACNVITNMVSVIPYIGTSLILWIWGGFSVNTATLGLLFVLHFLFPFIVFGVMIVHIILLHNTGSTSSIFTHGDYDKISFHPYYTIKDSLNLNYWIIFFMFLLVFPWYLGDVEMFIEANTTASPVHIVPEWYFLYVYAILRSIPNKVLGVIALVFSFVMFYVFPIYNHYSTVFDVSHYILFWLFISNCIILTWIGGQSVEMPFTLLGLIFTVEFFVVTTLIGVNFKIPSVLFS